MSRKKLRVAVLYGGRSGEHEVSLRSAAGVIANLDPAKYILTLIGIDKTGVWYLQPENQVVKPGQAVPIMKEKPVSMVPGRGFFHNSVPLNIDFVLPILHGTFGEDGTIQGLLETIGVPYMGSGVLGSALGMDKGMAKKIWIQAGLPVVPFIQVYKSVFLQDGNSSYLPENPEKEFPYPLIVKPSCAGSSVGVHKVENSEDLESAMHDAFRYDLSVLIEPCIVGREIECSVIGNHEPQAFIPGEIESHHSFYDYAAKYIDPDGASLLIPAPLSENVQKDIKTIAIAAYKAVCAEGLARVDFFIENGTGRILLNEINTLPGFTDISMFSMLCEHSGLPYPKLLDKLVELGLQRSEEHQAIEYSWTT